MLQYLELLKCCLNGAPKADRTGTGTTSVFGYQMRFNLQDGFPLLTTKKLHIRSIIHELLWMISGDTNIKYLNDHGVTIWDEWADENGDLGPVYGQMWRDFPVNKREADRRIGGVDQLYSVIEQIKQNPTSRRLIVTAWHPGYVEEAALPPCHCFFQFYVNEGQLSCQMYQRSADVGLGLPFNIASYALLTHMVAQVCDLHVYELIISLGDAHVYNNHIGPLKEQLKREPRILPMLRLSPEVKSIDAFRYEDFEVVGYNPHPHIHLKVAV